MITKEKIAERVKASFGGGQVINGRKLDDREIFEVLETVRNGFLDAWQQEFGALDGEFVTQYRGDDGKGVDVLCDAVTLQKYSILPSRLISLSGQDGLRQVSPMKNQQESFIRLPNGGLMSFAMLEAGLLAGNTGYYIERVKQGTNKSIRIYYQNIPVDYNKVLIKAIASVSDFENDEHLPIPAKYEEQVVTLVLQAFKQQEQTPLDVKTDSNPDIK